MLKIKEIQIKNFRSIAKATILLDSMNIFVGLNDAGKSNVLKALNLFFNDETEPGVKFNFESDYCKSAPEIAKKAKEIEIKITFSIPKTYKDNEDVIWTKTWRRDGEKDNYKNRSFSAYSKVPTLFKRIKYKYVPAVKSNDYFKYLLADLYDSISNEVGNELVDKTKAYSEALASFTARIGDIVEKNTGISTRLTMPENQSDIFKALVFSTSDGSNKKIDLSHRGDGIKSIHIPAILKFISEHDLKLMEHSAIPVTTIWGYEEPENGIELLKSFGISEELYSFSKGLQMLITTHSPAFYSLNKKENVKTFFVSKNDQYQSVFSEQTSSKLINEQIGMMPLIAPYIKEQADLVEKANYILNKNYLTDIPTIMVEGETDVAILKIAIKEHSKNLQTLIENDQLRIITKTDGTGCDQIADWAFAWLYSGFKSKAFILFDKDKAGIAARSKIVNNEIYKTKQNNSNLKIETLEPSKDIVELYKKGICFLFELEHLLSIEFWQLLKTKDLIEPRSNEELHEMFRPLFSRDKALDNTIEDAVEDILIRDTIVYFNPMELKKKRIVKELEKVDDQKSATEGLKKTVIKMEQFFIN